MLMKNIFDALPPHFLLEIGDVLTSAKLSERQKRLTVLAALAPLTDQIERSGNTIDSVAETLLTAATKLE